MDDKEKVGPNKTFLGALRALTYSLLEWEPDILWPRLVNEPRRGMRTVYGGRSVTETVALCTSLRAQACPYAFMLGEVLRLHVVNT